MTYHLLSAVLIRLIDCGKGFIKYKA